MPKRNFKKGLLEKYVGKLVSSKYLFIDFKIESGGVMTSWVLGEFGVNFCCAVKYSVFNILHINYKTT